MSRAASIARMKSDLERSVNNAIERGATLQDGAYEDEGIANLELFYGGELHMVIRAVEPACPEECPSRCRPVIFVAQRDEMDVEMFSHTAYYYEWSNRSYRVERHVESLGHRRGIDFLSGLLSIDPTDRAIVK